MSKIYATGLTGTIGKHLLKPTEKIGIDLASPMKDFIELDISPNSTLLHLAAIVGETEVQKDRSKAFDINVNGSRKLAEIAAKRNCAKFIYISTSHVYKRKNSKILESDPLEPMSFYAETKIEAENEITKVLESSAVDFTIIRVFSILDWGMPTFTLGGAIERVLNGEDLLIRNGEDERDFLSPRTIAEVIFELAGMPKLPKIVNLCSSHAKPVFEAAQTMFLQAGQNLASKVVLENSDAPVIVGDNSLIRNLLEIDQLNWTLSQKPM